MELIEKHINQLAEEFDAVQILACRLKPDGHTLSYKKGTGLWHARQGLATEFIQEDINEDAAVRIARNIEPPDDSWKKE